MSKLVDYVGFFQVMKDSVREKWGQLRSENSASSSASAGEGGESNFQEKVRQRLDHIKRKTIRKIDRSSSVDEDFSHLTRPKTRSELLRISAAVMGIEFSYAAETAFVSPLLLNIGLRHRHMTLMWCLSPMIGFFLTPLLGSLSDGCKSRLGRRRPFILLLSVGIILGLLLVPNGKLLGRLMGDTYSSEETETGIAFQPGNNKSDLQIPRTKRSISEKEGKYPVGKGNRYSEDSLESSKFLRKVIKKLTQTSLNPLVSANNVKKNNSTNLNLNPPANPGINPGQGLKAPAPVPPDGLKNHPWSLVFTVLGTVLLDFDADACQSPSRAYMLDVTIPEDHAKGLSTFTVMAGLGGSLGYFLGALDWENTLLGDFFGGQVRAVFTLVLFIFIGCVITTVRSFREIPLKLLWAQEPQPETSDPAPQHNYGSTQTNETTFTEANGNIPETALQTTHSEQMPTFREYVRTIVDLPKSLQWLCLTNYFCWMSLVCYSLYFTDFVGEAVFSGDPTAVKGSEARSLYDAGVRFGCWGMSLYSLSCSIYSLGIEALVNRFGARQVYIRGQIVYSIGMVFMALTRSRLGVILFSPTAGIMYATLFTMPYLLVARYHAAETFDVDLDDLVEKPKLQRGLGTDVAIVSSMVFLAQMSQALVLGSVVSFVGSTTAIVWAAALFSACGSYAATKVLYLDL